MSRSEGEYFRFRWSHRHPLHLRAVRVFNAVMSLVPFRLKYWVGQRLRRNKPPYNLLEEDSVVVQVGAPSDTLRAGRSRGMYFALSCGRAGRVVIIEPDADSAALFESNAKRLGLVGVTVLQKAAWSERASLTLHYKPSHPAAGFVEDLAGYSEQELGEFEALQVDADSMDNLLAAAGVENVDLLSITTNGAEEQVLDGMATTLARGVTYISLARTSDTLPERMRELGYEIFGADDRGFTFTRAT